MRVSAPVSQVPYTVRSAVRSAGAVAIFHVCRKYFKSIYLCVFVDVCLVYLVTKALTRWWIWRQSTEQLRYAGLAEGRVPPHLQL